MRRKRSFDLEVARSLNS